MTPELAELARAVGLVGLAVVAHLTLRRAARRLPRWLAARRGIDTGGGSAPGEASIALACLFTRFAVWLAVFRVLARRYQLVAMAQARFESTVGMSVQTPLFTVGERSYSLGDLLALLALLTVVWVGIGVLARSVRTHVARLAGADRGVQDAVTIVVRYALSIVGTIILLQAWGIDVSSLTIVVSVLGVGVGFGLQNIANNFVSGFLLTLERPIKPGDFVQIGELMGTVERIGARSTEVRTLDRVSIIVPNAHLLEKEVVNWSHGDPMSRIHVPVSIEYGADLRRARAAMLEAARTHRDVLRDPRPAVEMRSFGESGIQLELLVWTREPRRQAVLRSDLGFEIFESFARHGITIPFPQQDVHLHAPALERPAVAWARRSFTPDELAEAEVATATGPKGDDLPEIVEEGTPATWSHDDLVALASRMRGRGGVAIADRRHLLTAYRRVFVGSEAVAWLRREANLTRDEALSVGRLLVERRLVHHVLDEHGFEDEGYFYASMPTRMASRRRSDPPRRDCLTVRFRVSGQPQGMEDVVVFAALGWEARAALDALQGVEALGPRVWRGYLGDGAGVRVLQIGVGLERAERAVAAAAAAGLYVSCGCAGALQGGLHAGDLVLGDRVVPLDRDGRALGEIPLDARALATFSAARGIPVRVCPVASSPVMLASADAKREAARHGAAVVEMESAAVVRMARERGVACAVVKVVLDEAHDAVGFPGAEVVDAETGEVDVARAARSLAMRPDWWLRAARLARRQRVAERRLREYLAVVFSAGLQALGRGPRTVGSVPSALVG